MSSASCEDLERSGDVSEFEELVRSHQVERVVIAFSSLAHEHLLDIIRMSKRMRVKISVVPRLFEVIGHNVEIDQIEGMTLLGVRGARPHRVHDLAQARDRRDRRGARGCCCSPRCCSAVAIAIKLDLARARSSSASAASAARNQRVQHVKFRTMIDGADR